MIRVLVVDDSAFMRKMIADMLSKHAEIEVIDKARNGKDAVDKVMKLHPDVVTMDVEMPVMSGLEALKEIMQTRPTPVVMVSSITKKGTETTIKAMEYGAFDFISKPSGSISLDINLVEKDLIEKVIHASKVSIHKINHSPIKNSREGKIEHVIPISDSKPKYRESGTGMQTIVAIGTSTGGPKALHQVITKLPSDFPYPILIVQHMPKGFTKSLSERLDSLSAITVKEAKDGEILKKGIAYIAPGGYHLKVRTIGTSVAIHLDQSELVNGHRPSVDTMFLSLSSVKVKKVIAVIMTGMGTDGKKGLVELKEKLPTLAIAESEKTSIVFGMPKSAIETSLVDKELDLDKIAKYLVEQS
ncbi:protein-glutamate methylesterase/protein-glutamine glutaminase [Salipaludibacillus neizhouensis]|nr:chemotaxis response regulator protein-glutamate methylesterase [Salipaludibacillus neizhouensis]